MLNLLYTEINIVPFVTSQCTRMSLYTHTQLLVLEHEHSTSYVYLHTVEWSCDVGQLVDQSEYAYTCT